MLPVRRRRTLPSEVSKNAPSARYRLLPARRLRALQSSSKSLIGWLLGRLLGRLPGRRLRAARFAAARSATRSAVRLASRSLLSACSVGCSVGFLVICSAACPVGHLSLSSRASPWAYVWAWSAAGLLKRGQAVRTSCQDYCRLRAASATTTFVGILLPRSRGLCGPPTYRLGTNHRCPCLRRLAQFVGRPELFWYSSKQSSYCIAAKPTSGPLRVEGC